jgi:hypothetical protein
VIGLATRAARVVQPGNRAAVQNMASPALFKFSLSRKAALRSGAAMAAMMAALVSCGGVSKAFLTIFSLNGKDGRIWGELSELRSESPNLEFYT